MSKGSGLFLKMAVILYCLTEVPFQLFFLVATEVSFLDYISVLLDFALLLALVGFVWKLPLLKAFFWKLALGLIVFWQLFFVDWDMLGATMNLGVISENPSERHWWPVLVISLVALQLIKFVATFLYAFRSDAIWKIEVQPSS